MTDPATVVARARACLGARFRPHGRDPALGLDCVGLAAIAAACDPGGARPLRSGDAAVAEEALRAAGCVRADPPAVGDLLLLRAAPTQLHLAVRTEGGFVHADAALRRVVEVPGAPAWPLVSAWRAGGEG